MKTLFLNCNDPCEVMKPPWHAFASFSFLPGMDFDIRLDTPTGWFHACAEPGEEGGTVLTAGKSVCIDCWEDVLSNCLRFRKALCPLYACTLAECLFRMAPLLDAVGAREEVTECLINNL